MKFPVFLLGLVVSSVGIAIVLWVEGLSVGKSLLWALIAFGVGQILYVAMIAVLAALEKKSLRLTSKSQDTGVAGVRGLSPEHDRHV
jgi:hypothetical protein